VFDTSDIYSYCLFSWQCFEKIKRKVRDQSIEKPLLKDLLDTVKTLGPIYGISLAGCWDVFGFGFRGIISIIYLWRGDTVSKLIISDCGLNQTLSEI
jgi:hypothetical protein